MIDIQVDDSGLELMFSGLEGALRDLTPVWPQIRDIYMLFLRKQFETEGSYASVDWAPLKASYARWKATQAPGQRILRFRDRLYGSLTEANHADMVFESRPLSMEWGTRVPYAHYHQTGTKTMPMRVVLPPPTREQGEAMVDALLAYMFRRARGERR